MTWLLYSCSRRPPARLFGPLSLSQNYFSSPLLLYLSSGVSLPPFFSSPPSAPSHHPSTPPPPPPSPLLVSSLPQSPHPSLDSSPPTPPLQDAREQLTNAQEQLNDTQEQSTMADNRTNDNAAVQNLLGAVLERLGQTKEAEDRYRKAVAINSTAPFHCDLAMLLSKNRQFSDAAEEAYKAFQEDPASWRPWYALGILSLEQADEYHDDSYYKDAVQQFGSALAALAKSAPPFIRTTVEPVLYLDRGYAYGKLRKPRRATSEFRKAKASAKKHSRTWFAAEANLRRYQRKHSAESQTLQTVTFITLGVVLSIATVLLELKQRLTTPYLVTLIAFVMILFVISFSLPIITSINLGPVALEKKAVEVEQEQLQPISPLGTPLDVRLDQWVKPSPLVAFQSFPVLPAPNTVEQKITKPPDPKPSQESTGELFEVGR